MEKYSALDIQNTQKQWLQSKCQRLSKDVQLYINQVVFHVLSFIFAFSEINFMFLKVAIWTLNFRNEFDSGARIEQSHSTLNSIKTLELYRKTLLILQVRAALIT